MRKKLLYQEGDVFGVPLDTGGFALGLAARVAPKGKILLGYFFRVVYRQLPSLSDVPQLNKEDAVFVARLGDLGLYKGLWPVIGHLDSWEPQAWPMPMFARTDIISGGKLLVQYADNDPSTVNNEVPINQKKTQDLAEDDLWGCGAVEEKLTELLHNS